MLQGIEGRLLAVLRVLVFEQGLKRSERVEYVDLRMGASKVLGWAGNPGGKGEGLKRCHAMERSFQIGIKVAIHASASVSWLISM